MAEVKKPAKKMPWYRYCALPPAYHTPPFIPAPPCTCGAVNQRRHLHRDWCPRYEPALISPINPPKPAPMGRETIVLENCLFNDLI